MLRRATAKLKGASVTPDCNAARGDRLGLRAGDMVEVRTREEILATLGPDGTVDGLPFMPEMLEFAGKQLHVLKRADKTCDTIEHTGLRRMYDTVHLEATRCSGAAHGGCQAGCEIFWKEAWLRHPNESTSGHRTPIDGSLPSAVVAAPAYTEEMLDAATQRPSPEPSEVRYRCQATDLLKASEPLDPLAVGQYVRDLRSGNVGVVALLKSIGWSVFRYTREHLVGYRVQIWLYNKLQRLRGGRPLLNLAGTKTRTPLITLDLEAGERVCVKGVEEIRATLDAKQKNRGLYFDIEMVPNCGLTYQVRHRVEQIIEESTGRMIKLPGANVILEGAVCTGRYHRFCPRAIYPFWREAWLDRVDSPVNGVGSVPGPNALASGAGCEFARPP